jgi:hypothetical protein
MSDDHGRQPDEPKAPAICSWNRPTDPSVKSTPPISATMPPRMTFH